MVALRLIAQSLLRERRLFGLWVASLCVAVSGLLIVDVFRNSLSQTLVTQGQNILTADVAVNSRRSLNANELAQIKQLLPGDARFSTLTEMFAMVSHSESGPTGTRLGSLRFIDDSYPLRGELLIERAGKILPLQGSALGMEASAWVAPDFLSLMNVRVGDTLKIGEVQFRIDGVVRKDSSQTFRFGSMAPRIFLHRKFLEKTKLVQFGSTFSENLFAAVTAPQPDLKIKLENLFADPSVQITVPTDLEQGSLRVLTRLLDFLGLTGLVTLCLGWIGVYYLGRRWLSLESSSAGVLKCLGFSNGELQRYLLLKLLIIMLAGILSGGLLAWLGAGAVLPFVQDSMPTEFNLSWSWSSTLLLILVGPVAGILLMLPSLRAVGREQPLVLIQGTAAFRTSLSDFFAFAATTAVLFSAITFVQARSWRVTFIFLGSLLCTLLVVAGLGLCVIAISRKWQNSPRSWKVHLALSQWNRRRALALLLIMVSAMAGLLSQLIPNIEKTLVSELQTPSNTERPALFLFDIQDEQLQPLKTFLTDEKIGVYETAPFVRARILKVNGAEYERAHTNSWTTREEENDSRFRNRGVNLSYRADISGHEKLLQGKPWTEMGSTLETAEISVEQGYADRIGVKLGDILKFDVQGIEIDAKVASIREVDWDSFQPNFFIMFRSGVLDEAPKTWIMTIKRSEALTPAQIQAKISGRFTNVTSINVQEALENAASLFAKLGSGLKLASGLCMGLGLFVFLMILLFQLASSQKDWMQLHVLGLRAGEILWLQLFTYGGLCMIGVLLGALMSLAVAESLARFAFHARLAVDWLAMLKIFGISIFSAGFGMIALSAYSRRRTSLSQLIAD